MSGLRPPPPQRLDIELGSFGVDGFHLEYRDGQLRYGRGGGYYREYETVAPPSEPQLLAFRNALEALDVWHWQRSYDNIAVLDGTQWEVTINWGRKRVSSHGSNAYPRQFGAFLDAVRALIHPHPFYDLNSFNEAP
ncbi:hypothetical protein [Sedimenticola hydrogenitrophicus]|uniref:hypothetical protein n=1 Tax=Sedimenticola hydrogenitrophicus TaxID=2967975 RepID=UPI0023B0CC0C|nr:hypothetical protein [Sedimenticola hydrogenitrophicus]